MATVFSDTRRTIRALTSHNEGDRVICHQDNYCYRYDADNDTTDNDETYLKPYDTILGRWVREKEYELVNL